MKTGEVNLPPLWFSTVDVLIVIRSIFRSEERFTDARCVVCFNLPLLAYSRLDIFTSCKRRAALYLVASEFLFCVRVDLEQIFRAVSEDVRRETHVDSEALPEHWNPV